MTATFAVPPYSRWTAMLVLAASLPRCLAASLPRCLAARHPVLPVTP
ncbi:hypothetical protein [Streptomyces sp. NBC_01187]|nr:hypothetical protein OG220_32040 [Streptomyces sp. NBC_01187]